MNRSLTLLLPGLVFIAASAAGQRVEDLLTLQRLDQRVADTGYRLAHAATPLCADRMALSGITLHGIEEYGAESRDEARRTFGFDDALRILAVARGSPAEAAGLRAGDAILAIDDRKIPPPGRTDNATARIETVTRSIEHSVASALALDVARDGIRRRIAFVPEQGCVARFWVRPSSHLEAEADGHDIEITSAYVARVTTDAALAIVLAHELAHNILRHRERLDRDGARGGFARFFGRSARLRRVAELEADRLSITIIGCAGYSLDDALAFRVALWRDPLADLLLRAPDHPPTRQRLNVIRQSIAAFEASLSACRDQAPFRTN
jgi:hypothetical protein